MTPAIITYKTKIKEFADNEGKYIEFKKSISKADCNLKPHQHQYYNSDMFNSMLRNATIKAQAGKLWCRISELPECISIKEGNFLSTVTINIELR